ncbi:MAG TPA: 50S ribosomal protein L29 [Candidatus Tyrphobacter sp.]|nr:50S ribosomal protein L29 [Candidatus Tyrphobacter sp.]
MKKSDLKDLKSKSSSELEKNLTEAREKLRTLIFQRPTNELKNPRELGSLRKKIARILTILHE